MPHTTGESTSDTETLGSWEFLIKVNRHPPYDSTSLLKRNENAAPQKDLYDIISSGFPHTSSQLETNQTPIHWRMDPLWESHTKERYSAINKSNRTCSNKDASQKQYVE